MAFDQRLEELKVSTPGRGFTRLNERLNTWLAGTGLQRGMLHLTCLHTSASLTINENADPRVLRGPAELDGCGCPPGRQRTDDPEAIDAAIAMTTKVATTCRPTSARH